MTSIGSIFNIKSPGNLVNESSSVLLTDDMVGVEVELEGVPREHVSEYLDSRVNLIRDGSLRNHGAEFVFGNPMFGRDTVESIHGIFRALDEAGVSPQVSERCSVHVHLDVRDFEYHEVLNLIVVYLLCEPYFFKMGGTERMFNPYTVPLAAAKEYLEQLGNALSAPEGQEQTLFRNHIASTVKYSALNVAPILTQGSVEFRHHEGTDSPARILNWVNMVLCLKRYVRSLPEGFTITSKFIDDIVTNDFEEFITQMFRGCDILRDVASWDNAARVSKRVATIASGIPPVVTLTSLPVRRDNLFFRTQRSITQSPLSDGDIEYIVHRRGDNRLTTLVDTEEVPALVATPVAGTPTSTPRPRNREELRRYLEASAADPTTWDIEPTTWGVEGASTTPSVPSSARQFFRNSTN